MSETDPRDRYGRRLPRGSRDELSPAGGREPPAGTVHEASSRGRALFDERRFFEAHEFFEHVWNAGTVDERDRPFWKGVTQVAVGCCHAQRGNARGALALLRRAEGYLRDYPSPHASVDTRALIALTRHVADQVLRRGASADLDFPAFPGCS